MVHWDDPDLEAKLGILSVQLLYAILGLYSMEYIHSSYVEVALFRRQLPFRWPLLSYISARFSFLIATVLSAVQCTPFYTIINCESINLGTIFLVNFALGCSTTNLVIRTWLIWKTSYLRLVLVLFSLGHWAMLALFVATARGSTQNGVCMTHFTNLTYAEAVIIYSTLYDFVLLVFTIIGLSKVPPSSALWKKLVKQGVVYFIVNLAANLVLLRYCRLNLVADVLKAAYICTVSSSHMQTVAVPHQLKLPQWLLSYRSAFTVLSYYYQCGSVWLCSNGSLVSSLYISPVNEDLEKFSVNRSKRV
ncbi:hypothetical protein BDR07DRAFT_1466607 [Suillus spraguei]|nr:hypothetical protein BDR07DRAFT_1466607 [Suillus spraguei]